MIFKEKLNDGVKQTSAKLDEIKKERDTIEDKLISVTKDYTNAVNGNTNKLFSSGSYHGSNKKQHKIDEKKALMELWKDKLAAAVSHSSQSYLVTLVLVTLLYW